jgi:hypothetical protein
MKKLSGTVKFVILPAFAISSVIALHTLKAEKKGGVEAPHVLYFPNDQPGQLKNPDVKEFEKILSKHSDVYCMKHHSKDEKGKPGKDTPLKKNCPVATSSTSAIDPDGNEYTLVCTGAHVTQAAGFATQQAYDTVKALFQ